MASKMPLGVKVISILYYIGAVGLILMGIGLMVGGGAAIAENPLFAALSGMITVLGIILIGTGALYFFIGRGLWKGKNWSRWAVIIISAIWIILGIMNGIMANIPSIVVNAIIGGYLLFSKSAKASFA